MVCNTNCLGPKKVSIRSEDEKMTCYKRREYMKAETRLKLCLFVRHIHTGLIFLTGNVRNKWAAAWQNQQNDMCAQRRLRSAGRTCYFVGFAKHWLKCNYYTDSITDRQNSRTCVGKLNCLLGWYDYFAISGQSDEVKLSKNSLICCF